MNRYSDSPGVRDVLFRLELDPFGAGVVLIGPREHEPVAAALEERIPEFERVSAAEAGVMSPVAHPVLVLGLGPPGPARDEALSRLNGRREWFSVRRQRVVILVDPGEMMDFQRLAGDLWAAPNFRTEISYIPDPDVDEAAARARLAEHLVHKHGRLDLRGFVRAESEDVSFRVEDVFVEVSAAATGAIAAASGAAAGNGVVLNTALGARFGVEGAVEARPVLGWVEQAIRDPRRPLVLLGGPGAGKTFLLRWLALRAVREGSLFGMRAPFPVFISFATFARAPLRPTLMEHVVFSLLSEGEPAGHLIARLMEEGRVLFLFDGLDEATFPLDRDRIRKGLAELRSRAPRCPILLTSRIAGYEQDPDLDPVEVSLSSLDDGGIRTFLSRWCELYAVDRKGDSEKARDEGRKEGERLANDVLANPSVRQIAGNPLLLTVLAIVHRAGVRLPEHRVGLYDHATRVLVERWNRVRSEETAHDPAPPLKSADAVRLLGPLALRMVRSGVRATVSLGVLREELGKVLERGPLRGLATADEAIRLFRESLGLLVEQAPGVFSFLHMTLGEFFAALELVRTGELEKVAADPGQAFGADLREVLLLGAGILGVLRAEDARLAVFVENLLASADKVTDPRSELPLLLLGLLADDPGLTESQKDTLVETLLQKVDASAVRIRSDRAR